MHFCLFLHPISFWKKDQFENKQTKKRVTDKKLDKKQSTPTNCLCMYLNHANQRFEHDSQKRCAFYH